MTEETIACREKLTLGYILPKTYVEPLAFISESLQADDLVAAMVFIAAAAGVVKTGNLVRGDNRSFVVPPNIYLAIVANSGMGKTPVLNALCGSLLKLVAQNYDHLYESETLAWELENLPKPKKEREEKPRPYFLTFGDYTGEALSLQLATQEKKNLGILLLAEELSSVFTSLNSYKGGGKGTEEQQLLSLFDGKGDTEIRVKGNRSFNYAQFSIVGGIQTRVFDQIARKGDPSGLFARLLLLPLPTAIVDFDPVEPEGTIQRHYDYERQLQELLLKVHLMPIGHYKLSDDGILLLERIADEARIDAAEADSGDIAAVHGKRASYTLRIAGLLHILAMAAGEIERTAEIGTELVEKADLITTHLQSYALSAHRRIEESKQAPVKPDMAQRILHVARDYGKTGITAAQLRSYHMCARSQSTPSKDSISACMDQLVRAGMGSWRLGQRGARFFHANP